MGRGSLMFEGCSDGALLIEGPRTRWTRSRPQQQHTMQSSRLPPVWPSPWPRGQQQPRGQDSGGGQPHSLAATAAEGVEGAITGMASERAEARGHAGM